MQFTDDQIEQLNLFDEEYLRRREEAKTDEEKKQLEAEYIRTLREASELADEARLSNIVPKDFVTYALEKVAQFAADRITRPVFDTIDGRHTEPFTSSDLRKKAMDIVSKEFAMMDEGQQEEFKERLEKYIKSLGLKQRKRKDGEGTRAEKIEKLKEKDNRPIYIGTSQIINYAGKLIASGSDYDRLNALRNVTVKSENGEISYTKLDHNSLNIITLPKFQQILQSNSPSFKIYLYLLDVLNEKAFDADGNRIAKSVTITVDELISCGMFTDVRNARKCLIDFANWIAEIKFRGISEGKYSKEKNNVQGTTRNIEAAARETVKTKDESVKKLVGKQPLSLAFDAATLFTAHFEKNVLTVFLNTAADENGIEFINWQYFFNFVVRMPQYAYILSNNAIVLLYHILNIANQRGNDIANHGSFDLSYSNIVQALCLPGEETIHVGRDNVAVIQSAILEINDADKQYCTDDGRELVIDAGSYPDAPTRGDAINILRNGKITITVKGDTKQYYLQRAANKKKKFELEDKRRQHIKDEAQIRATEKKITKENNTNND